MFENPKNAPYCIQTHKFDIEGWQFVFVGSYQGDLWMFQWSELLHLTCKKPISFKWHNREVRGYCRACDIRMPYSAWEVVKSHVSTLRYGNKLV